jgi:hypothetical protein
MSNEGPPVVARANTEEDYESPKTVVDWFKRWEVFRMYLATHRAIRRGEQLHDLTSRELAAAGFLGPWKFNLYETAVAAVPAQAFATAWSLLAPSALPSKAAGEPDAQFVKLMTRVLSWLLTTSPALVLLLLAYAAGRASLRKADVTRERSRRATRAFLYLDGAYGLVPQMCMALALTAILRLRELDGLVPVLYALSFVAILVHGTLEESYEARIKIPTLLFAIHGYRSSYPGSAWILPGRTEAACSNAAPWRRYQLFVLTAVPTVTIALLAALGWLSFIITQSVFAARAWIAG